MSRARGLRGLAAVVLLLALAGWAPAVVRPWTVMVQFTGPPESNAEVENLLQDLLNGVTENVHLVIQTNYPVLPGETGGKGIYVVIPGSGGRAAQYSVFASIRVIRGKWPFRDFCGGSRTGWFWRRR